MPTNAHGEKVVSWENVSCASFVKKLKYQTTQESVERCAQ